MSHDICPRCCGEVREYTGQKICVNCGHIMPLSTAVAHSLQMKVFNNELDPNQFMLGELVNDLSTGYIYCKGDTKFSFVVSEEDIPCLGSKCPKRDLCFKYNEAKKFSEDKFIIRDLSTESYQTDMGWEIYCNHKNRYRHFRWND